MLSVLAQALIAALRVRLPGYADVTPDVLQRRFLETPGEIITSGDTVTVRLERRAYSPVLRQADLPNDTRIPWWEPHPPLRSRLTPLPRTACVEIRAKKEREIASIDDPTRCGPLGVIGRRSSACSRI